MFSSGDMSGCTSEWQDGAVCGQRPHAAHLEPSQRSTGLHNQPLQVA